MIISKNKVYRDLFRKIFGDKLVDNSILLIESIIYFVIVYMYSRLVNVHKGETSYIVEQTNWYNRNNWKDSFLAASILDSRNNYSDLTRIQIVFFCYQCSCRKIDHVFFSKCSKNVLFLKFNLKL